MRSFVITLAVAVAVSLAPTAQAADAGHLATFAKTYHYAEAGMRHHHAKAGKRHAVVAHTAAIVCRTRSC